MVTLAIAFYFLIGFICAVIFEIRSYASYDLTERTGWLFLWPIGLFGKTLDGSVEFCIHKYYDLQDWRLKVAAKAVEAYKHKSNC